MPVRTKIPAPIIAPTPIIVASKKPRVRAKETSGSRVPSLSDIEVGI